ncbi:hypothetical protein [Mycobacteroides abscessus]|uniref:hypothetical protein n=1 Tax=Mycobacteroides abscessus TaxID=36809 RepID=UPI00092BE9E7|nr:hypothetical protein [Mycobacteroides abscessus]MDO3334182.1 hypothetical protein [Mycobacteroides abscessus subsp. bolletii]QSM87470.1 hypothetical protein I3U44_16650 [Mycobacteroides abscessus subsp. bolletii]SIB55567.1 Uncharacterised protein [Mycobacteroides abscessus subsp. bolletii]SII61526.1 Uncharacterised protein [Mycobacteroides abscessus subsp. bolletii]SKS39776.1 Uncharacterised protein [Mycobacteroides abscessus subsp. bolletii]
MNMIMVSYDLNTPGQDYSDLNAKLKSYGTYWHHLDSFWLIGTNQTCVEVCDIVKSYLDKNDELLVMDVTGDAAAWVGFSASASKWLKENL